MITWSTKPSSDVLECKGERACAQMKHFRSIYQHIAVVTILYLTNTELLSHLSFPSTGIFCGLQYRILTI